MNTRSFKMIQEIKSEKLPIKMWLDDLEDGALQQARNLANLPFAFKHIALMPDCHQGFGMPIEVEELKSLKVEGVEKLKWLNTRLQFKKVFQWI